MARAASAVRSAAPRFLAVSAPLPNGEVLIAGGRSNSGSAMQSAELFNPVSDTFTALPASDNTQLQAPVGFVSSAASLPKGEVLIAGGQNDSSNGVQNAELFNPADDTFTALPASGNTELQAAREGAVATALPNGQVLIAGGASSQVQLNGNNLPSAELYVTAPEAAAAGGDFGAQTVAATVAARLTRVQDPSPCVPCSPVESRRIKYPGGGSR